MSSLEQEYQSWSGIVENIKVAGSDSLTRSGKKMMGFTISPPKVDYNKVTYELFIYIYLLPLQWLYDTEGLETTTYIEFSKAGRLHFHGKVEYTDDNLYGPLYRFLNGLEYSYESRAINRFVCRTVSGKKRVIRFPRKAQVKSELHVKEPATWNEYVSKDVVNTNNIIAGISRFVKSCYTVAIYKDLQTYIIARYNIEN